jgi:hypothetical protein
MIWNWKLFLLIATASLASLQKLQEFYDRHVKR